MTIRELKELLQRFIDNYEETYGGVAEVSMASNTYFLRGATYVLMTPKGFIDLENPLDDECEEY